MHRLSSPVNLPSLPFPPAQNSLWGMSSTATQTACQWLRTGDEVFPAMLAAIDAARTSVCLEIYIFASGPLGQRFRETLIRAQLRGARVRVLIDAFRLQGFARRFLGTVPGRRRRGAMVQSRRFDAVVVAQSSQAVGLRQAGGICRRLQHRPRIRGRRRSCGLARSGVRAGRTAGGPIGRFV